MRNALNRKKKDFNFMPPQIFALHGFLGSPKEWHPFPFITHPIELSNENLNFQQWSTAFNKSIPESKEKKFLLGYSLGGRLAMHALLSTQDKWDGAIFISAHPGLETAREREKRKKHDLKWACRFQSDPWKLLMHDWEQNPVFAGKKPANERAEDSYDRKKLFLQLTNWSLGYQSPLLKRLQQLQTPMLVIAGEEDTKFCSIARKFSSFSQTAIVPNAAHRVPWERPQIFSEIVQAFIEKVASPSTKQLNSK